MEYIVRGTRYTGMQLEIERIPRQTIDDFAISNPKPIPPLRKADVWGDPDAQIPDTKNPDYVRELAQYYIEIACDSVELIADAVMFKNQSVIDEMKSAKLVKTETGIVELIRFGLEEQDQVAIVDCVMWQSTVTERGIERAAQAFNVTWNDRLVTGAVRKGEVLQSGLFEDRTAAQWAHYKWHEFCALWGYEQSEVVAHRRIMATLERYL